MSRLTTSKKIAIQADGDDFTKLKALAVALWGATEIFDEYGTTALITNDGTLLELYTSYACFPDYFFRDGNVIISYKVEDIQTAVEQAKDLGIELLTDIIPVGSAMRYCHLKLASGIVIGIYQESDQLPSQAF